MDHLQPSMRELTAEEIELVSGGQDGQTVIVTGTRNWEQILLFGGYGESGSGTEPHPTLTPEPGAGNDEPIEIVCLSEAELQALSAKAREAYDIAVEAAEIAREMMSMPDIDQREYGAVIYRDANGVITHTLLREGTANSVPGLELVLPTNPDGSPAFQNVLAIIHSHTAATYSGVDSKLFPTPPGVNGGGGDWGAFDSWTENIKYYMHNYGYSSAEIAARIASFHQYILGPINGVGTGAYELRKYHFDDRDNITLGQKISLSLGTCGA